MTQAFLIDRIYPANLCKMTLREFCSTCKDSCSVCKETADLRARLAESQNAVHAHSKMIEGLNATVKDREDELQKAEAEVVAWERKFLLRKSTYQLNIEAKELNEKLQKAEAESERRCRNVISLNDRLMKRNGDCNEKDIRIEKAESESATKDKEIDRLTNLLKNS